MRTLPALLLALGATAAPAAAREPCDPPHKTCDGGRGITYPCRPCPPRRSADDPLRGEKLETYRRALEAYRQRLETLRDDNPRAPLGGYRKGIESYREGLDGYRDRRDAPPGSGGDR